ncbi:acyltransferase family protein [Nocardioides jiangxiensis]|uniref:Acyltransferase family protein n=1 Tax=Nocardioides jiangxiensis TaxID=3064524 RepID=A0ABT9B0M9_9ACTN|nr:acyltransferase family protein [Nocardioides sp. WY-20]MDO7867808.1 acyltransferase family protein [Nocardioides sp. WY-20]
MGSSRVSEIDGVRGLAAAAVFTANVLVLASAGRWTGPGDPARLASTLGHATTLFVVVSGFALYQPYVGAVLRRDRPPGTSAFLCDRALRLGPALAGTALAVLLAGGAATGSESLATPGATWPVGTLLGLNLAVPAMARRARRALRRQRGLAWASWCMVAGPLALTVLATVGILALTDPRAARLTTPLHQWEGAASTALAVSQAFALGMVASALIAVLRVAPLFRGTRELARHATAAVVVTAVAAGLTAPSPLDAIAWTVACAAGITLLAQPGGPLLLTGMRAAFRNRVMAHLGRISLGIWLWHAPAAVLLVRLVPTWRYADPGQLTLDLALVAALTLAAAEATQWLVDRPLRRAAAHWLRPAQRQAVPRLPAFLPDELVLDLPPVGRIASPRVAQEQAGSVFGGLPG